MSSCLGYSPSAQAEDTVQITNVFVERTDNDLLETVNGVIEIEGSGLKDAMVRVRTTAGRGSKVLGVDLGRRVMNENVFLKFELTGPEIKSIVFADWININGISVGVDYSNFPTINSVEPKVVYLGSVPLTIKGSNLDKANLSFGQGSLNGNININPDGSQITISNISGDTGFHDIIFTRENSGVENVSRKVSIRRIYQNQFRVVQEKQFAGLEMYPNKGVPQQTTVYFRAPHLEESSVFFLRDINDPYYAANLGTHYHYQSNVNADDIITVKVPNLTPGTYQVVLTNRLTNPPAGTDLRGLVVWQQVVGSFLVISASNAAQIVRVEPNQGPNLNSNKVTVIGQNFNELLIDGLTMDPDQTVSMQVHDNKSLVINYGTGTYSVGTASKNVQVERTIKVFIGEDTLFQPVDQQEFSTYYDNLRVLTPVLNDQEIQDDPYKDVVVELTTTLKVTGTDQEYRFIEQAILENGYLFVKSYTAPSFTEVIPNSIPVVQAGGQYETREDLVISIIGQDFMVNKFTDPGTVTEYVYYPLVNLGGTITIKREGKNSEDVMIKDASGAWKRFQGASMEVLNGSTVIDGTVGKEVGTRIVIRIPAGISVSSDSINATFLEVTNPMKDTGDYGYPIRKEDMIRFVIVDEHQGPVINSVEPHVVPTEGEKGVQIKGSNFQVGVRVFIDGLEVKNIKRDPSSQLITFDAPPGREGETRLVVMNPDGAADSAQFIYVKTQTDLRITSISPSEGTIGTLVVINGEGFLGPDPTASDSGMGIYRLLGARVLFDNEDINEYRYKEGSTSIIEPQGYTAPQGEELLRVEDGRLVLADYYLSILLRDSNNKYYIVKKTASGQGVLTDGVQEWTFAYDGTKIMATDKSGNIYDVTLDNNGKNLDNNGKNDQLTLTPTGAGSSGSGLVLDVLTPYRVDGDGNIVGHRAKVVDNGKRILVTIPNLQVQKYYDVTVINPDTKRATKKEGFYFYLSPQRIPVIEQIIPDRGSTTGGYYIDIIGENFERTDTIQTRVFIDGVEVPKADTIVSPDLKSIRVKVPPYKGDLAKELGVGFKAVPVVVLNPSDGGSSGLPEGFTYVVPTSQPFIDSLVPAEGTAAGGDYVQIIGRDFRLYEPYQNLNNNSGFDPEVDTYTDINGNGQWDDLSLLFSLDNIKNRLKDEGLNEDKVEDQVKKLIQVLPRVYFGSNEAQVTDFSNNRLVVKTPASQPGTVSVYVVNNDYGVSNSKPFTFKGSSPRITAVIPDVGRRQGGEIVEIHGSGLQEGTINILGTDKNVEKKTMPLVRFGSLEGSGTIIDGRVSNLDVGGYLTVKYNANVADNNLSLSLQTVVGQVYQQDYSYDGSDLFIDLSYLQDSQGQSYGSRELVRVQLILDKQGYRLQVQRGFAPEATLVSANQIRVTTPPYYTVGQVDLSVINPDGSIAKASFTYRNPDSNPRITNITRDDQAPVLTDIEGRQVKILRMNYQGESQVKVFGTDFRENAIIKIGNLFTITPDQIIYTLPDQLTFTMPKVPESEIGKLHRVVVINEDGGTAASDEPVSGKDQDKIYLQFTKGETEPAVEAIDPVKGPASGGTRIKIAGKDFRKVMEGYGDKSVKVFVGGKEATAVEVADYKTIWATTPPNNPGTLTVRVENPDGQISIPAGNYTYISTPQVTAVVDPTDPAESTPINEISVEGGQEIKIKGSGFMPGAKVVFAPVLEKAASDTGGNIIYRVTTADNNGYTSQVLDPYLLKSGSSGTDVRFIDENTLTVKTPPGKLDTMGLIVVNPDQGASENYGDISYELPELPAPEGKVYAEIIHDQHNRTDRAIKVSWNGVAGAREYEIYVVRGSREEFIGSTQLTSYIFNDLEPNTRYRFIIKAVGNFGSSKPSQESNWVKTGSRVGPPDEDGKLGEKTEIKREGTTAYVNIGRRGSSRSTLWVDLTKGDLAGSSQVAVAIPASVVASGGADIVIQGKDFQLRFNPRAFNTAQVYSSRNRDDAGIRFRIAPLTGTPPASSGNILSTPYQLEAVFFKGAEQTALERLAQTMTLELKYDIQKAQLRRLSQAAVYRYDSLYGNYVPVSAVNTGTTVAAINQMGIYTVMGSRR
mgnify:FL=1